MITNPKDIYFSFESPEAQTLLRNCEYLFSEFIDYGLLLHNKMVEQNKDVTGVAPDVLFMFYREIMEITDGIGVLLSKGCVVASIPLIRTQMELYAQIARMIKDSSENSARAYLYCHRKEMQEEARQRWENKEITDEEYKVICEEDEKDFSLQAYQELNAMWEKCSKKNSYPKWFNIINNPVKGGIYKLLSEIAPELSEVYNHLSNVVHGNGGLSHSLPIPDGIGLHLLRRPFMFSVFVKYSLSTLCFVYSLFSDRFLNQTDSDDLLEWFESHYKMLDELIALESKII